MSCSYDRADLLSAGEGNGEGVEADDTVKVPEIGCSDAPSGSNGSRRNEAVMRSDVLAGRGEVSPDAGVCASGEEAEWQQRERGQNCLDEGLTACSVLRSGAMHAMQQLRGRDGGDPDLLVWAKMLFEAPAHFGHGVLRRQAADGAFKFDKDGGV
jgi:hypothetical protein